MGEAGTEGKGRRRGWGGKLKEKKGDEQGSREGKGVDGTGERVHARDWPVFARVEEEQAVLGVAHVAVPARPTCITQHA